MRVFHCDVCAQTLYFENSDCIKCGHTLAYLPELGAMTALAPAATGRWPERRTVARGMRPIV